MIDKEPLKLCPFCGENVEVKFLSKDKHFRKSIIGYLKYCLGQFSCKGQRKIAIHNQLAELWNRRTEC